MLGSTPKLTIESVTCRTIVTIPEISRKVLDQNADTFHCERVAIGESMPGVKGSLSVTASAKRR